MCSAELFKEETKEVNHWDSDQQNIFKMSKGIHPLRVS
jgi:hypothetical protein